MKKNLPDGKGILYYANGGKYSGDFKENTYKKCTIF